MNFSKPKIIVFFATLIVLAWFLYPRDLFLGFIYEGTQQLEKAEDFYHRYLGKRPGNKFATLRLGNLYERIGTPQRATPLLKDLYLSRKKDWKVATRYLDHLENLHDEEGLYLLRREVAKNFMEAPLFPKGRVIGLLEEALDYAIWTQKTDDVYAIIDEILRVSRGREDMRFLAADFDRGLQKTDKILSFLKERLAKEAANTDVRTEISNILMVLDKPQEAIDTLSEGIRLNPKNKELLSYRIVLSVRLGNLDAAIADAKTILSLKDLPFNERAYFIEQLSVFYHDTKREAERLELYQEAVRTTELSDEDRLFFAEKIDIFYRDEGKMDEVLALYEEIIRNPTIDLKEKFDYVEKLAFLYLEGAQIHKAIDLYRTILSDQEIGLQERVDLYERMAFVYGKTNEPDGVVATFRSAIGDPNLPNPRKLNFVEALASFYSERGRLDEVIPLYRETAKIKDLGLEERYNLVEQVAFVFNKMKRPEKVIETYREAIDSTEFGAKERADFVEKLAAFYAERKKWDEAVGLYQKALDSIPFERDERYFLIEKLAFTYNKMGQPGKLVETYQKAIHSEKLSVADRIEFVEKLAAFYSKTGKKDKVLPLYDSALLFEGLTSEEKGNLLEQVAFIHLERKEIGKAIALYQEAIRNPELELRERLNFVEESASLYTKLNRQEELVALYTDALGFKGLDGKDRGFLLEQLTFVYGKQKRWDDVTALYQEALKWEELTSKERLNFVTLLANVHAKTKREDLLIGLYETEIEEGRLDTKEQIEFMRLLAEIYTKHKKIAEADRLYRKALELDDGDPDNWLNLIYFLGLASPPPPAKPDGASPSRRLWRLDEQIELMKHYLSRFPEDTGRIRLLIEIYLYKKEDTAQLPLYASFVRSKRDEDIALSVEDLLIRKGRVREAEEWIRSFIGFFPDNPSFLALYVDAMTKKEAFEQALSFCLDLLEKNPRNPFVLANAAKLYNIVQKPDESEEIYQRLLALDLKDYRILKAVGIDILFSGNAFRALHYLRKAQEMGKEDPELMFWLSEALTSQAGRKAGLGALREVIRLLEKKVGRTEEEERILVKSKGRLSLDAPIHREYEALIAQFPRNAEIHADYLDLLIEARQLDKADAVFARMLKEFPEKKDDLKSFEIRIASAKSRWEEVVRLIGKVLQKKPTLWSYRRDLAESYLNAGDWKKAITEYEKVYEGSGDQLKVVAPLRDLYALYDNRVTTHFTLADFGGDDFKVWGLSYQSFVSDKLQIKGEGTYGLFHSPSSSFDGQTQEGKFSLGTTVTDGWSWGVGGAFGHSSVRSTPSASGWVKFTKPSRYGFGVGFDYRQLRTDFPQAVSGGDLKDAVTADGHVHWGERIYLYGRYQFSRNYLPNGLSATDHFFEPGFSYRLTEEPEVSVGYHFTFGELDADGGFLVEVPLVEKLRSHIISVQANKNLGTKISVNGSFFAGEDTARNTHLFEGDLLGASAGFVWNVMDWVDGKASYTFGKESLATISGTSHQFTIELSGHWH